VTSIGEVARLNVVFHVESPGDTFENPCTTASCDRMLATSSDLSDKVGAIQIRGLEYVVRSEGPVLAVISTNEGFGSCFQVGPTCRAPVGLDEGVMTTCKGACHPESIGRPITLRVVTLARCSICAET